MSQSEKNVASIEPVQKRGVSEIRFLVANLIGHIAAAYSWSATMLVIAGLENLFDPRLFDRLPTWSRVLEGVLVSPFVVSTFAMLAALLLIPYSLVGAVIAWFVVSKTLIGSFLAMVIGGSVGMLLGCFSLWHNALADGLPSFWFISVLAPEFSACAAGAAYGWVIWRLCIKAKTKT